MLNNTSIENTLSSNSLSQPIGAPHLGAPFSLRALVSGDCMGLETFLNDSEALAMGRSLGSIPWMIPSAIPDNDHLNPRSCNDYPPVKNIKAIYGINLPTEVGAIYKRKKIIAERKDKVKARFELDENAKLPDDSLWVNDDGILFETKDTPQTVVDEGIVTCSGDGTVPYWSLQHVNTWKDKCNVEVIELEGARHREILADERLHELLIDHVTIENNFTTSEDKV